MDTLSGTALAVLRHVLTVLTSDQKMFLVILWVACMFVMHIVISAKGRFNNRSLLHWLLVITSPVTILFAFFWPAARDLDRSGMRGYHEHTLTP